MIRSILLIIGFLTFQSLQSQEATRYRVQGNITDQSSGEPVENVNIRVKDEKMGATSNKLGAFELYITKLPFTLEFSHVSYKLVSKTYDYPPEREINIQMNKDSKALKEVIVTSQKIDTIYRDDLYSVLDYELLDDGIMLLIYKARLTRSELLFTDFTGNKKLTLPVLPGKPLALFKDCMNNIHVVTKGRVYQVYKTNESLRLYDGIDVDYFNKTMGGCLFSIKNKLYFEGYSDFDFVKWIFYIDTVDSSYHELVTIIDTEKFDMLYNNPDDFSLFSGLESQPSLGDLTGTGSDMAVISNIRNFEAKGRFIKMAYYGTINAPVLNLGDSLYIFNHPNNSIDIYNFNDSLQSSAPVDYHLEEKEDPLSTLIHSFAPEKKWLGKVYADPDQGKMYTLFQNINGTRDLKEIDPATGKTSYVITIPFPFVHKINIKNGFVYFVYRGWGEMQRKKLFRQQIN